MNIRNAAKALIVQQGKLLAIRCRDTLDEHFDEYFVVPGGGQEHGESLEQCLRRECKEEINVAVEVKDLVFIREYIGKNHEFVTHNHAHQIEFFFLCTIRDGHPAAGETPDTDQIGIAWLPLDELEGINFYPRAMRKILAAASATAAIPEQPVYLGDIN